MRNAAYALNHLLENLYIDGWDLIGPTEKQRWRNLLHKQKHLGKRILLLDSPEGIGRMYALPDPDKWHQLTG
jgi:hypothetical protein